ncbi:MAG: class I SAM-dependent methyltransferase [Bacteroidales bacterium]|nr:class I SAM-dependent methyltransferase [Bacteroidales bacterium]
MNIIFRIKTIIYYFFHAQTIYLIHSPFVFSLIKVLLDKKKPHPKWDAIEHLHHQLKRQNEIIEMVDFGAKGNEDGSVKHTCTIAKLAHNSAISKKQGRMLSNIVRYFQPKTILELGTSLGIGTAYLACEQLDGTTITIEGSPKIAEQAHYNFETLSLNHIHQVVGSFDAVLPDVLNSISSLDFVYIDGNHTHDATLRYFELCLSIAHNDTIFIFDDIHWSPAMLEAWEKIKSHPRVTVTLDFYRMGCAFLRKESSKENFIINTLFH